MARSLAWGGTGVSVFVKLFHTRKNFDGFRNQKLWLKMGWSFFSGVPWKALGPLPVQLRQISGPCLPRASDGSSTELYHVFSFHVVITASNLLICSILD